MSLSSPSPSALLYFSKTLIILSHKASKHLPSPNSTPNSLPTPHNLHLLTKKLKASVAALALFRYLHFPPTFCLSVGLLTITFKFSKNLLRVLEAFLGIQADAALRTGFEAVDLLLFVTREFSRFTGSIRRRKPASFAPRTVDRCEFPACLNCNGADSALPFKRRCPRGSEGFICFPRLGFDCDFCNEVFIVQDSLQTRLFELLCLAFPIHAGRIDPYQAGNPIFAKFMELLATMVWSVVRHSVCASSFSSFLASKKRG